MKVQVFIETNPERPEELVAICTSEAKRLYIDGGLDPEVFQARVIKLVKMYYGIDAKIQLVWLAKKAV